MKMGQISNKVKMNKFRYCLCPQPTLSGMNLLGRLDQKVQKKAIDAEQFENTKST
jgi:hypothetical protein